MLIVLNKRAGEAFIMFFTLVAVAALNYTLVHNPFVFVMVFLLLVHELGHYFAAKRYGVSSSLPFFIPFPFLLIGVTLTKDASKESQKAISFSGAFCASLSILILIFFNIYYKIFSTFFLTSALLGEILFNYIGVDGNKYRSAVLNKKEYLHQHIETKFSKEKLWKAILKSPKKLKHSELGLKVS